METFLKLDYQLLNNKNLSLNQKVIIAFLQSFQAVNKYCFHTQMEMSEKLGIPIATLKREIKFLLENNIIFKEPKSLKDGKRQYKNRKSLIFIDENNQPKTETTPVFIESLPSVTSVIITPVKKTKIVTETLPVIIPVIPTLVPVKDELPVSDKVEIPELVVLFDNQFQDDDSEVLAILDNSFNNEIQDKIETPIIEDKILTDKILTDKELRFELENCINDLKVEMRKKNDMVNYYNLDILEKDFTTLPTDLIINFIEELKLQETA